METVAQAVTAAKVQLGIGHERRFEPGIIDLRARLAAGELGTALLMEGNFSQDKFLALPADNWRLSAVDAPVGPLSATGIHIVDLSIALFGKPKEVWARLATRGSPFANGDTLGVMIAFESGATAMLTAILATPFMGRIAVYGSQGWIEIRDRTHPEHPTGWDVTVTHRGRTPADAFSPAASRRARQPRGLRSRRRRRGTLSRQPRRDRRQRAHLRGHHALRTERQAGARLRPSTVCKLDLCPSAEFRSSECDAPDFVCHALAPHIHVDVRRTMRMHGHNLPSDGRTPPQSAADSSRVPGDEFPVAVYLSVVAAFAWILLASWLAFGVDTEADLGLSVATVLGIVFFALPILMYRTATHRFRPQRQRLDDFLSSPVDTATGRLTGAQAWLQVLVIPLVLAFAAIAIGAVHLFAA